MADFISTASHSLGLTLKVMHYNRADEAFDALDAEMVHLVSALQVTQYRFAILEELAETEEEEQFLLHHISIAGSLLEAFNAAFLAIFNNESD